MSARDICRFSFSLFFVSAETLQASKHPKIVRNNSLTRDHTGPHHQHSTVVSVVVSVVHPEEGVHQEGDQEEDQEDEEGQEAHLEEGVDTELMEH